MPRERRRRRTLVAFVRWLALVGLFATLPGIAEAIEDTAHWVQSGHTVHDRGHAEDASDRDAEHGCSGMQHICRCCPAALAIPGVAMAVGSPAIPQSAPHAPEVAARAGLGARAPAFRPPIA